MSTLVLRLHGVRDARRQAVRTDDQRGARLAHAVETGQPHADHAIAVTQQLAHQRAFAHLGAGPARGVDQQGIEHGAPRAIHDRGAVDRFRPALQSGVAEVNLHLFDRRTAGRRQRHRAAPTWQGTPWSAAT